MTEEVFHCERSEAISFHRIKSTIAERIAAQNAPNAHRDAYRKTTRSDGLMSVL